MLFYWFGVPKDRIRTVVFLGHAFLNRVTVITTTNQTQWVRAVPALLIVAGGAGVFYVWGASPVNLVVREPIAANVAADSTVTTDTARAVLTRSDGRPSALPGSWRRFRGDNLDAVSREAEYAPRSLARRWPDQGPPVLWSAALGEGYAGAAASAGKVYVVDYDQALQGDAIRCLSLDDGREIWRYFYPVKIKRNHGMSRTVPTVTDRFVVAFGPKCHVTCLDPNTGEVRWFLDLVKDYGAKVPPWYAGQCPWIQDDVVVLAVGGDALLMAVDLATGRTRWTTPNPRAWTMTHSSIVPMTCAGRKTLVYCASGGVVGVSAEDGTSLWETTEWRIKIANVPTPVVIDSERVFLCGGYNSGSLMLRLRPDGDRIVPEVEYRLGPDVFGSDQQTPILFDGYLYGVRPDEQLVCMDLAGKIQWTSGAAHKFGIGPYTMADGLLYVLDDQGVLTLVEAVPTAYQPLARARVLEGPDAWGPMAVVSGRLLARDLTRMVCLDIYEP